MAADDITPEHVRAALDRMGSDDWREGCDGWDDLLGLGLDDIARAYLAAEQRADAAEAEVDRLRAKAMPDDLYLRLRDVLAMDESHSTFIRQLLADLTDWRNGGDA